MELDTFTNEDEDWGPEDDIDDSSEVYPGNSSIGIATDLPLTHGHKYTCNKNTESGLMVHLPLDYYWTLD